MKNFNQTCTHQNWFQWLDYIFSTSLDIDQKHLVIGGNLNQGKFTETPHLLTTTIYSNTMLV